ncbi:MAG: YceD family protein [Thermomicrobiales bacterium]
MDLYNETVINVAALLQEPVGSTRSYPLRLAGFPLDEDMLAEDIEGEVKVVRLAEELLANVAAHGAVELECDRCLREYHQPFTTRFAAEFRPTVDVRTGIDIAAADGDERFTIDDSHQLDVAEPLRQEILVALPMRAICGDDCPGPDVPLGDDEGKVDERFAALAQLLDNTNDDTRQTN